MVSIPFIAGQWSLRGNALKSPSMLRVSIPFIAGQWSLRRSRGSDPTPTSLFQSPSLRGSGRFLCSRMPPPAAIMFQSPSLRGSGRFSHPPDLPATLPKRFNPLHCGAVVASGGTK